MELDGPAGIFDRYSRTKLAGSGLDRHSSRQIFKSIPKMSCVAQFGTICTI